MNVKPLKGILAEIVEYKMHEVADRKKERSLEHLQQDIEDMPPARDFQSALRRGGGSLKLLAEIKAASPSAGAIRSDFDPAEIASLYENSGASAVSVLTDRKYFSGADEHIKAARSVVSLPVLRKDFTIDEYQLYESRAIGADAVLLMAQVLTEEAYADLYRQARQLGLHVLAEGHSEDQIRFIVSIGAEIVGINNRDFDTMTTDLQTTLQYGFLVPPDRILVSQSGMFTREDVIPLDEAGVDAIQVGTSLMQNDDMKSQIDRLLGKIP
ncbi:MAG: indole-3-glycerol phosphate synthase TrpC [Candidatus Omnitrophica bacterium]|nr:indole-3-glycerol phosphate synthase TrpC [Candidatus Omnitrophota bacterium]